MRTPGLVFALAALIMLASCSAPANPPGLEDSAVEEPSEVEEVTDHREPRMPQASAVLALPG